MRHKCHPGECKAREEERLKRVYGMTESGEDLIVCGTEMHFDRVEVAKKGGEEAVEGLLLEVRAQLFVRLCKY